MDPSNAQEHQAMATHSLEDMLTCPKPHQERRLRPPQEQALKCPRCDSNNTKFCYYNNYSLSQPRYFCKGCRRYWTQGGTLRNVPVGGGCRKNKKPSSSKRTQDQAIITTNSNPLHPTLPPLTYESNDLTLSFTRDIFHKQPTRQLGLGFDHDHETSILGDINTTHCDILGNPNTTTTNTTPSFLDALRSGFLDTQSGLHNFYYGNAGGGEVLPYEELSGATTTTTATTITTTKQEFCKDGDEENRMFCNFPWKINGEGDLGGVGSGRECWNNGLGSSWHGLLNSRMM